MTMLPATQFGCGFTVTCGVKFILLLNLALNVTMVTLCLGYLVWGITSMQFAYLWVETTVLGFAMAGLPIIVMAYHGVVYRNEAQVRLYLFYMWILMIVATIFIFKQFVFSGACQSLPDFIQGQGSAWACGISRYIHIAIVVVSLAILAYFQHVVYSHCQDLAEYGGGPELADLALNKEAYLKRSQPTSAYSSIEGMASLQDSGPLWETAIAGASPFNTAVSSGLGGGRQLNVLCPHRSWKTPYHEMTYPPHGTLTSTA